MLIIIGSQLRWSKDCLAACFYFVANCLQTMYWQIKYDNDDLGAGSPYSSGYTCALNCAWWRRITSSAAQVRGRQRNWKWRYLQLNAVTTSHAHANNQSISFYRAMHVVLVRYCYRKSSVRPSVCLSVCPSVTLMYPGHVGLARN